MSNTYRHHVSLTETTRLLGSRVKCRLNTQTDAGCLQTCHSRSRTDRRWLFIDLPFRQQDRPRRKGGACSFILTGCVCAPAQESPEIGEIPTCAFRKSIP